MMRKLMTMRTFLESPAYMGGEDMLVGESWRAWRIVLVAAMGEGLTTDERVTFAELTGRTEEPGKPVEELWGIVGRRGGKSRAIAALGVYLAVCLDHRPILAPGQLGLVPILSASQKQATEILNYAIGMFATAPGLAGMLATDPTAETITLKSRIELEIRAASFRRARGFTAVGAIGDEVCFWRSEQTVNPDVEILNALRPSLATTGGPLIVISSAYAKRGEVYRAFRSHYGPDGDPLILVVKAPSKAMNPSLSDRFLARAYEKDSVSAASEYGSEFRSDIDTFIAREVIEAAVAPGVYEIAPASRVSYSAFVDPSGGGSDAMTLAIGHLEDRVVIIDAVRERKPPFSPDAVVQEFAHLLRTYGIRKVEGDRYAGLWPRERFVVHGVTYEPSAKPKSDLYRDCLPLLNGGRVQLLDNATLVTQLCNLERRTARGGRDSIDHPPMAHDDLANVVAGLACALVGTGWQVPVARVGTYINGYVQVLDEKPHPRPGWTEQGERRNREAARAQARALMPFTNPSTEQVEETAAMLIREGRVAGWERWERR